MGLGENASTFASFIWYENWWRNYSAGANLNLLTMWDGEKLVGIAPLSRRRIFSHRVPGHGLPVTIIGFIENGNSLHNDFIVLPMYREIFLRKIMHSLLEQHAQWDVLFFNNLPVTSPNYDLLINILDEAGMKWRQETTYNSPYLVPSGSWADYLASRTTRTRKSLHNIHNSMHKAGEVSVRNIRSWEEFQQVRADIYSVAKHSWTGKYGDSMATPENMAFFDALARDAAANGCLSVWTLCLNNRMIAFEFHLKACAKDHAMRGSYLPEFARLSPGTYLEMQILVHAFEESGQLKKYDFGGSFDSYKRKWTDDAVQHCAISIFNDNIYSRMVRFHETKTVPVLKHFRDVMKQLKSE